MRQDNNRGPDGTNPFDKSFQHHPDGVREDFGGDGLTSLYVTHMPPSDDNFRDFFESATPEKFWHYFEELLERCDEVMLEHDWDRKLGNGRNFPNHRSAIPFSDFWYAGKIGAECFYLLRDREKYNDQVWILKKILSLGMDIEDQSWRARYRATILSKIKQDAKNRTNGKQGGQADKKRKRYDVLDNLAGAEWEMKISNMSDARKVSYVRGLAAQYDREKTNENNLFFQNNKPLGKKWFTDWLADFYIKINS
jgi:hypothetical protein